MLLFETFSIFFGFAGFLLMSAAVLCGVWQD